MPPRHDRESVRYFPRNPAVQRALQGVGLGSHQSRRPQQRVSARSSQRLCEELFTCARQHDRIAMNFVFLARKLRKLKIHQPVVTDVGHQIRSSANLQLQSSGCARRAQCFHSVSGSGIQEIENRLSDLPPTIGIGHEIHILGPMFEYAALQNLGLGLFTATDPHPICAAREKRLHAIRRPPVQVSFRVFPVPKLRGDRNNPLALIVGQRHKNVHRANSCILSRGGGYYAVDRDTNQNG